MRYNAIIELCLKMILQVVQAKDSKLPMYCKLIKIDKQKWTRLCGEFSNKTFTLALSATAVGVLLIYGVVVS